MWLVSGFGQVGGGEQEKRIEKYPSPLPLHTQGKKENSAVKNDIV
jgi:hypothetical protein